MSVEIAVQDVAGARAALRGGADRCEVGAALALGGLTPSVGLLDSCLETGIPCVALIRPRPGDFVYTEDDVRLVERDLRSALSAGASGVVIGALSDGQPGESRAPIPVGLDVETMRRWCDVALETSPAATITLHRCVDVLLAAGMPADALVEQCVGLPLTRVLSSGGAVSVGEGLTPLRELHGHLSPHGIAVMAGGGLTAHDVPALVSSGITEFHLSASRSESSGPAGPGGGPSARSVTDESAVRLVTEAFREALART